MYNFNNVGMTKDLLWFAKRYNALLVKFPKEITPEVLKKDDVCSRYDSDEAFEALKTAHEFLTSIVSEMLLMPEQEDKRMTVLETVFSKIDLFWGIVFYGELYIKNNEYCMLFEKSRLKNHVKTLPSSYVKSFKNIIENGCYIEYYKDNKEVNDYKSCDTGIIHFDNRLTALGIYIFIKKVAQKKWYGTSESTGNYSKKLTYDSVKYCAEPYHRVDMRVFICGERLKYNILEQLAGYSEENIKYFQTIYNFIKNNHPDLMPGQGFWDYINCTINFMANSKHRVLGGIGIGSKEHYFVFYCCCSGKEKEEIDKIVNFENVKIDSNMLYSIVVENEEDVKKAIHIMQIKVKYGKNIKPKQI